MLLQARMAPEGSFGGQHRAINGKIKTMTIKKEGREYHAIFTAEQERYIK